jgi:hypothetical protein
VHDTVIRRGTIVDSAGKQAFAMDGDRITEVGGKAGARSATAQRIAVAHAPRSERRVRGGGARPFVKLFAERMVLDAVGMTVEAAVENQLSMVANKARPPALHWHMPFHHVPIIGCRHQTHAEDRQMCDQPLKLIARHAEDVQIHQSPKRRVCRRRSSRMERRLSAPPAWTLSNLGSA